MENKQNQAKQQAIESKQDLSAEPVEKSVKNFETPALKETEKDSSQTEIKELTDLLQRTRADFENFRKRTEEQQERVRKLAEESVVIKILPILDNFALAINNHIELAPLKKSFEKTLLDVKIEMIKAEAGTVFNPDEHEAVTMEAGEGEQEVVAELLRPGYKYEGEVIRAAMVKVKTA